MSGSVRAARVALADALTEAAQYADARAHLARALRDAGEDPPGWAIHRRLADVAARLADPLSQLAQLLVVVGEAPTPEASTAGIKLGELLAGNATLAEALRADDVRTLLARARGAQSSPELLRTAVQVSRARGDTRQAAELAVRGDSRLSPDRALTAARVVAEAYDRIIAGADDAALALLDEHKLPDTDGTVAAVRAFARYSRREFQGAIDTFDTVDEVPITYHGALVKTLAALALASLRNISNDERVGWYDVADNAAAEAARLELIESGIRPALLLRAQAAFERGADLAEAGRLLDHALQHVPNIAELRWWPVQRRVRQRDDRFRCWQVRVAAARGDDHEVLTMWDQINGRLFLGTTTWLQDAELAAAVAAALERSGRCADAAAAYRSVTSSIERARSSEGAGDLAEALAASAAAYRLEQKPDDALKMAELYWLRSLTDDEPEGEADITQGLAVLDRLSELDDVDHVRSAYLRGLLLARRGGTTGSALSLRWEPLPWLLVAALADPDEPYASAHLAWALANADLVRQGLHFAERALTIGGRADVWLAETAITMRCEWYGSLSEDSRTLLAGLDELWQQTILGFAALLDDDLTRMRDCLPRIRDCLPRRTSDAPWAHHVHGVITARCHGFQEARPIFSRLRDANTTTGPMAARVRLYLGDVADARRKVEGWEKNGSWDPEEAPEILAMCDLLDSDGARGRDALTALLEHFRRPLRLRYFSRADVPMLLLAYGERRGAADVLAELKQVAERYLAEFDPDPPSLIDGSVHRGEAIEAATREYVRGLLTVADILHRGADGDATIEITALISMAPTGPLAAALHTLLGRLPALRE
ncbi:MAG: hypothetical protein JO115_20465 [Pseudonocardiales bacterium]|nr:hypothetical protein [Pseudonocardiales bacterium]